jgi:hypothetical protein
MAYYGRLTKETDMQTSTESRYPVKQSMLRLSLSQRDAAVALRTQRPPVLEGTRVILDDQDRKAWYDAVYSEMERIELPKSLVNAFCDVAGVPD